MHTEVSVKNVDSTCNEGVLNAEAQAFQLLVAGELDPHEAPR